MYLDHFGLAVNPFGLSPKLDFLYKSETFEESMAHLIYGLDHQEAIVLITGAIGTGKTMALQSFLMNLGPRFEFALITNTRLTAVELLKLILEDLDIKYPLGSDKSDLLILFKDFLLEASRGGKRVLIVVDEAQNLSPEVLEEIRLLTNLGQGESQPVTIILVGQPELVAKVNQPDLAQLRQRIRVHYDLEPLSRKEIEEYLDHRMRVAGCTRKIFTGPAIDTMFKASRGIPRLVNTMAGEALLTAFVAGHDQVLPGDVEGDMDLSFETGPPPGPDIAPAPSPAPAPDPVEATLQETTTPEADPVAPSRESVAPPPGPAQPITSRAAPPRESVPMPEVRIPFRNRESGALKVMRGWFVAALVVVALATLYFLGFFDGVTAANNPESPEYDTPGVQSTAGSSENEAGAANQVVAGGATGAAGDRSTALERQTTELEASAAEGRSSESQARETNNTDAEFNAYIHISSFRTPERAESLKRKMGGVGPGVASMSMNVRGEYWYRVYIGPYVSTEAADKDALRLQQAGTISFYRLATLEAGQLDQP